MKVLVTGSSGYVGRHLVFKLQNSGHEVYGLDEKYFPHRIPLDKLHFIFLDIRDTSSTLKFVQNSKIDTIINLAAKKSVAESFRVPDEYLTVNATALDQLISQLLFSNVQRFVQASTAAVYGLQKEVLVSEEAKPNPLSPYAKSKHLAEQIIANHADKSKIDFSILRFFNILGNQEIAYQDESQDNLIPSVIRRYKNLQPALIYGDKFLSKDGTAVRDYIHVLDVVDTIASIVEMDHVASRHGIFNIGSGVGHSVLEVINGISALIQEEIPYKIADARDGDIPAIVADITKAKSLIDFRLKFSFNEMLFSSVRPREGAQ